ncbi:hypothetical protein GQ42DRAFT_53768 [Ramicandelaber brevisporus]|nr:hypothetical protein GQ42DRAFT_53768 [Ramicandelaber brevisporus]
MSVPELVDQLSALYTVIDERVQLYPRMAKLSGRLDMVNEQILAKIGGRQGMLAALARDSASAPSAGKRSVAEPAAVFTEDDNGTLSRVAKKSTKASRKPARDLDSDDDDEEDDDEASDMDISDADMDEDSDDEDEDSDEDVAEFSSGSDDSDVDSDDGSDLDLSEDDGSDDSDESDDD